MSTALVPAAGGGTIPQMYFCYQCNRTVTLTPSPSSDLLCPICNGGFLEEQETPSPNPNSNSNLDPFSLFSDQFSSLFPLLVPSSDTSIGLQNPRHLFNPFDLEPQTQSRTFADEPENFNPIHFLQNYLENLRADGANIQFVVENHPSDAGFRLPANIGDYFIGPGLEQLIQQLAENDPSRHGTPPATKSAVEGLPSITITDEILSSDLAQCAVCKDEFEKGMEVKEMPCKHIYHSDCILPWLELHSSCPVCRYELPTDDQDNESRTAAVARGSGNSSSVDNGGGESPGNLQSPRMVERSFRISLPWPFSLFGSDMESSGGEFGNSNRNGSNPGGHQN